MVQGNASLVYDNSRSVGGGLSAKHQVGPRGNAYYEWNRSFGTQRVWFGRVYVWFDSLPSGNVRLVRARGAGVLRMAIDVLSSGQLAVKDNGNRRVAMGTTPIMTGGWVRIEWRVDQTTGQVEVRLFNSPNLPTPTDTAITAPGQQIGPSTDQVQIGRSATLSFSSVFWTDDPAVSNYAFVGPVFNAKIR